MNTSTEEFIPEDDVDYSYFQTVGEDGLPVFKGRTERKSLADLERVIALGKPQRVIDLFAELVASTEQWDWLTQHNLHQAELVIWQEKFEAFEPVLIESEDEDAPIAYTEFEESRPVAPIRPTVRTGSDVLLPYKHNRFKEERASKVAAIKVEVDGMMFDGDETSQDRMVRAITVLVGDDTVPWRLANNETVLVTQTELKKALILAGQAQASMWIPESD